MSSSSRKDRLLRVRGWRKGYDLGETRRWPWFVSDADQVFWSEQDRRDTLLDLDDWEVGATLVWWSWLMTAGKSGYSFLAPV